eukprot:4106108-Prymnesium_polylepis.1
MYPDCGSTTVTVKMGEWNDGVRNVQFGGFGKGSCSAWCGSFGMLGCCYYRGTMGKYCRFMSGERAYRSGNPQYKSAFQVDRHHALTARGTARPGSHHTRRGSYRK